MRQPYKRKRAVTDTTRSWSEHTLPPVIRRAIIALAVGAFGSGMSMRVADPMLIRLADEFDIGIALASWVVTVFGFAYGVSQLLFGPLGDRYGKVRVVAHGCAACSVTALLCAFMPDFAALLVARALAGAMAASVIPLSMAWIGDVVSYEHRQPVLAKFLIGQILGLSAGVVVGGLSADYFGWRFPFFLIAVWFAATSVGLHVINRSLPAHARVLHVIEASGFRRMFIEFRHVLRVAWAQQVLLTVSLEGAVIFGALAFVPAHLHSVYGLSLASSGSLVMLFGIGGLIFAMRSPYLVSRLGEVGLINGGTLLVGVSLLLLALTPVWWLAFPACAGFGLGFYMLHNTLQINATQMAPERRGAAVAAFASCFFLGQALGVAAAGAALAVVGTRGVLAACAALVVLVGLRFGRVRRRRDVAAAETTRW